MLISAFLICWYQTKKILLALLPKTYNLALVVYYFFFLFLLPFFLYPLFFPFSTFPDYKTLDLTICSSVCLDVSLLFLSVSACLSVSLCLSLSLTLSLSFFLSVRQSAEVVLDLSLNHFSYFTSPLWHRPGQHQLPWCAQSINDLIWAAGCFMRKIQKLKKMKILWRKKICE